MASRIYETAIRIKAAIDGAFKVETLSAAGAISRLGAEAKKLTAASAATESFTRISAELAAAKAKYDTTAAAVQRLADAERAAGGPTKESAKWTAAGARALKQAEREFNRASHAAGNNAAALSAAGVKTANLAHEQHRLAEALELNERRTKAAEAVEHHFGETLEKVAKKAKELSTVEGSAKIAGEHIKGLGETAKHAGELLLGAEGAAFALFEVAKGTAEAGGNVEKMSERLGIGAQSLQLLRFAGKASHVEVEELDAGLGKLAINIGKVAALKKKGGNSGLVGNVGEIQMLKTGAGGKAAAAAADPFHHIGLAAKKLAELQPEQQVAKIADAFAKLKTHSEKAAAAQAIFGKGGSAWLPLLAKGGADLEEKYAEARAAGNILSAETLENSAKFHHAYLLASEGVMGMKNTLGAALLPTVIEVMGEFNKWVKENSAQIKQWAEEGATWIGGKMIPTIKRLVPQIAKVAREVGGWIEKGVTLIGGVENLGKALLALRLAPTAFSIAALGVNVGRLALAFIPLAPAMAPLLAAAAPIAGVVAAIGLAVAAAYELQEAFDAADLAKHKLFAKEANRSANRALSSPYSAEAPKDLIGMAEEDRIREEANRRFHGQATPQTAARGNSTISIHYNPQITVSNGNESGLQKAVRAGNDDLEQRIRKIAAEQSRLSFAH